MGEKKPLVMPSSMTVTCTSFTVLKLFETFFQRCPPDDLDFDVAFVQYFGIVEMLRPTFSIHSSSTCTHCEEFPSFEMKEFSATKLLLRIPLMPHTPPRLSRFLFILPCSYVCVCVCVSFTCSLCACLCFYSH